MKAWRTPLLMMCFGLVLSYGESTSQAEMSGDTASPSASTDAPPDSEKSPQASQGAGTVLVLGPAIPAERQIVSGLVDELSDRYTIARHTITADTQVAELEQVLSTTNACVLILLNNPTVRLYHSYQALHSQGTRFPPAVILMTAFVEQAALGVQDATGISYEVPAVTALVNLRSLLDRPVHRIGVLHRRGFESYIAQQRGLAAAEGFEIVGRTLEEGNEQNAVKRGLRKLLDYDRVDALWVLNDSALLSPMLVARGWLPVLRHGHVPVLVGVPSLVSPKLEFGTFAVFPDHRALGAQAAALIDELAERQWQVGKRRALLPIGVQKVLNLGLARTLGHVREDRLGEVDLVVGDAGQEKP